MVSDNIIVWLFKWLAIKVFLPIWPPIYHDEIEKQEVPDIAYPTLRLLLASQHASAVGGAVPQTTIQALLAQPRAASEG